MSLPEGITTCTVTVGVPVTHGGGAVKTYASIEPSVFLVHTETGTPLVDFLEELQIAEGVAGQFVLPHTDQPGFQDENGNAYTNWYYTARTTYSTPSKAKSKAPKIKVFQLVTGQTLVDLDLLPGGAPALPYTAPVAQLTSFGGRTGAVDLLESDLPARLDPAALNATYVPNDAPKVGTLTVGAGAASPRTPFLSNVKTDAAAAGTIDFSTHTMISEIVGDFTGVPSTNPGWTWGFNCFTTTGRGATDGAGIVHLTGALVEASIQSPAVTGAVIGLQAEAAFLGASAGGTVGSMMSMKVAFPKRKDGATAGNASYVYGLWIDSVPDGHLGSTEAYSLYVQGGKTHLGGTAFVGGDFAVEQTMSAYIGGHKLYNKAGKFGTDSGLDVGLGLIVGGDLAVEATKAAYVGGHKLYNKSGKFGTDSGMDVGLGLAVGGDASVTGKVLADSFARKTNSLYKILWGTGTPEGVVTASKGSVFLRTDGTAGQTLYIKDAGDSNTGWLVK